MPRVTQGERAILRRRPLRWHSEAAPVRRSVERWDACQAWAQIMGPWLATRFYETQTCDSRSGIEDAR